MRYIYPPRPKTALLPTQLAQEEARDCWLWQHKFNGDRCPVIIDVSAATRKVTLCNRHGKFLSATKFPRLRAELSSTNLLLPIGTHYLDAELLPNATIVLFDVIQFSTYLIGKTQEQRLSMLEEICGNPTEPCSDQIALRVTDHVWMSRHGDKDFLQHFNEYIENPLIEGLVLRKKKSILDNWGSSEYEVNWQIRCRKPSKKYRY
jgi:ATP-dependent DNA ligase